jgi:uncharacterized membrane protein
VHSDTQASATGGTFTTFDIPGSDSPPIPTAINAAGAITGYYSGANGGPYGVSHSFLRAPDGTVTTFDPPGSCEVSTVNTCGSTATSINPAGVIVGSYDDDSGTYHGFLRRPDGTFTTIDVPGFIGGDFPSGINPAGTVTGGYFGTGLGLHGFVRRANGVFTTFDPPDSSYTQADGINASGAIAGSYQDVDGSYHGFFRSPDGNIVTFGSPVGSVYDYPHFTINAEGSITGTYCEHEHDI